MIQIPVYDGMGNIIGYIQVAVYQLTDPYIIGLVMSASNGGSAKIDGEYIILFDKDGNPIGRLPLNSILRGQVNPDMPSESGFTFVPKPPTEKDNGGGTTTTNGGDTTTNTGGDTTTTTTTTEGGTTTTTTENGTTTVTNEGGTTIVTTTTENGGNTPIVPPYFPPVMPPITGGNGNTVLTTSTTTTNTPVISSIKQTTWDDRLPCPTVMRFEYKLSDVGNKTTIDLSSISAPIQSYLSGLSFGEKIDQNGRKIRKYGVDLCDLLKKIMIPSDSITVIYNTTSQTGKDPFSGAPIPFNTIKFEADINSSVTKNFGIRDGLTDGSSTPTYLDRLCDLMRKQSFSNGIRTSDMYVVFDYEFVDAAGIVHRIYTTGRVYIDENGRCVCTNESLQYCDCKKYTLGIRNLRVVSEPGQGFDYPTTQDQNVPWYNNNLPPDKQKVCFLKADVYRCCIDSTGAPISSERVGEVLLARSQQSTEWVDCEINGKPGKKIKVTQYFLMEDLTSGAFSQFRYDPVFTSKPRNAGFRFPSADLRGDEYYINERIDLYWSDCTSDKKFLWGDYIDQKLRGMTSGVIGVQDYTVYYAQIAETTKRPFNGPATWRMNTPMAEPILVLTCGAAEGECVEQPSPPPPGPGPGPKTPETETYCIKVTSFDIAKLIDEGKYVLSGGKFNGMVLPAYSAGYNSFVYPVVIPAIQSAKRLAYGYMIYEYADGSRGIRSAYDGVQNRPIQVDPSVISEYYALERFIKYSKEYYDGDDIIVESSGRVKLNRTGLVTQDGSFLETHDCKTGGYLRKQRTRVPKYYQFEICFTIEVHNPDRNPNDPIILKLKEQPKVTQVIGSFIEPAELGTEYTIFDPAFPFEYDPDCCNGLTWPKDRGPLVTVYPPTPNNPFVVGGGNTGGPMRPASSLLTTGTGPLGGTTPQTAQILTSNMPYKRPYLDHKMDTAQYGTLIDSCGCQAVDMADIWCYYESEPKSLWKKASKDDKDTWIRGPYIIPDQKCISGSTVYHPFDVSKDISYSNRKIKTKGLFNGNQTLECYLTSSTLLSSSSDYYYNVTDCENCGRIPYFALAYGNSNGSGSYYVGGDPNNLKKPTDAIYSQYQLLCNEPTRSADGVLTLPKFSFVSESVNVESNDIYVINYYRNGLSDQLDPGNFQINMAYLSGSFYPNHVHTGSNVQVGSPFVMKFIDDSDDFSQTHTCIDDPYASYPIVSGSLEDGKYQDASINTYGNVYPYLGVVVFHPKRLNEQLGFNTVTGSNIYGDNAYKLFTSISGAASPTVGRSDSHKMLARNVVYKTTQHYSVRVNRAIANYSNNPTYVSGSKNRIFDKCFIHEPNTYITSVGLYNENLELLAIGKMTKALKKDFDTDLLIKIRLNW